MAEEITIYFDDDGKAREYDGTYDIMIHCESEKERNETIKMLKSVGDMISKQTVIEIVESEFKKLESELSEICSQLNKDVPDTNVGKWIPVMDGEGQTPPVNEGGYSKYILLSFSNAPVPCIGQYREDDEGGAFFQEDDDEPLINRGFIVNAWMPLPAPYREE